MLLVVALVLAGVKLQPSPEPVEVASEHVIEKTATKSQRASRSSSSRVVEPVIATGIEDEFLAGEQFSEGEGTEDVFGEEGAEESVREEPRFVGAFESAVESPTPPSVSAVSYTHLTLPTKA